MTKVINYIKSNKYIIIFSFIESFLQVYSFLLSNDKSLKDFNVISLFSFIIIAIVLFIINSLIIKLLSSNIKNKKKMPFSWKKFLIIWGVIFLCWIPVFLCYYPSIWAYDANGQIPHLDHTAIWSGQPLFHTLLIELFMVIGKNIASYGLGMALFSIFQMLVMSYIFSYSIVKVAHSKKAIILLTIFFGIMPFNSILSISVTKDVLFSGILLLLVLKIYDLTEKKITRKDYIVFISLSILLMLLKNSIIVLYIVFSIIIFIVLKERKDIIKLCTISIVGYYIIYLLLVIVLNPSKSYPFEKHSTIVQNLSYISIKHPKLLNDDYYQKNKQLEKIPEIYNKYNADMVKYAYDEYVKDDKEVIKAWLYYAPKYPIEYLDSATSLHLGALYLNDTSHAYNIYDNEFDAYTQNNLYAPVLGVERNSKLTKLKKAYDNIASGDFQYKQYPIFRYLFEPASYVLSFFLIITFLIQKKRKKEIIPLLIPILLFLSILMGPCILVRYIYPYMIIVPILFVKIRYYKFKVK